MGDLIKHRKEKLIDVDLNKVYKIENLVVDKNYPSIITFDIMNKKDGRRGTVEYELDDNSENNGVITCTYEEEGDEDIYSLIHDFVDKYIDYKTEAKFKGKKIPMM